MSYNAHTPPESDPERWHDLRDHLARSAELAADFARPFGHASAGRALGLFHDLGKVSPGFQDYLRDCAAGRNAKREPHAAAGAAYLWSILTKRDPSLLPLAICCDGHHRALKAESDVTPCGARLHCWWREASHKAVKNLMHGMLKDFPMEEPEPLPCRPDRRELRLRMLFSALVDADFLDTEAHFKSSRAAVRDQWVRPIDLWPIFRADHLRVMWKGRNDSHVNRVRRQIYWACVRAAKSRPGVFRLTVPTGGGKTRSALGFALQHAVENKAHGFRRVIVALPYTSIIDQNARVFKDIFGDRFVLEHHSQVETPDEEQQNGNHLRLKLAAENWDFPLIVTTTVQLFESLFGNKPSRCRKLHNIARSILILDEVQTLPVEMLEPTMDVLRALVDEYGVTLVLSTATQPAFDKTPYLKSFDGMEIGEIVPEYPQHFRTLERVEYQPVRHFTGLPDLADELAKPENRQVLTILNTRRHALDLHKELQQRGLEDGLYHLSTLLCGAHRRRLLREITDRLKRGGEVPVRLISTQVVEAGVDLDFPVVYRAMGPLDRIVQAAGRCDREGRRTAKGVKGRVFVFDFPDNASPPGAYKMGLEEAKTLLVRHNPSQLHDPSLHTEYFQMLFRDVNLDKRDIQSYRRDLDFPQVAEKYKMIEDTFPVVITGYDGNEGERRLKKHLEVPSRETWRRLMPYIVNLSVRDLKRDEYSDYLTEIRPSLFRWDGAYDDKTHRGIQGFDHDPADLIQ